MILCSPTLGKKSKDAFSKTDVLLLLSGLSFLLVYFLSLSWRGMDLSIIVLDIVYESMELSYTHA